ncbi:MAG: class I SAM-dependent methyltransferase [Actinobacteria bacterium]|nr:class I SAM-dependent methyltransferase [Actinomycetota bacterium]
MQKDKVEEVLNLQHKKILRILNDNYRKILDLACGLGFLSYNLSEKYPHAEVIGIDGDNSYIERSSKFFKSNNLRYKYSLIEDIEERNFDLIVFSGTIEHLPNVGIQLKIINKIMDDNGTLIITTDNAHYIKFILTGIYYSFTKKRPSLYMWHNQEGRYLWWNHHIYSWTLSTLSTLLYLYGFKLENYWFCTNKLSNKFTDNIYSLIGLIIPAFRKYLILKLTKFSEPTILEIEKPITD